MELNRRIVLVTAAGLAASLHGTAAQAIGCPCSAVGAAHAQTRGHVTDETTRAAGSIIQALREQTRQTSQHLDRQVEADRRIADGADQNATMRLRERFRAEAESGRFDPNPDFCLLLDIADDAIDAVPPALLVGDAIASDINDWSLGRDPAVKANGVRLAAYLQAEHDSLAGLGGIADPTTDWTLLTGSATAEFSDPAVRKAVARLIANTINPFPPAPLSDDVVGTPAGLSEAAIRRATEAREQAAVNAILPMIDLAAPDEPSDAYRVIAARSRYREDIPDIISELQRLDIRTQAYYAPLPAALEERHGKGERALLQDVLDIQSLQARLSYLRLAQEMRIAILLAAMLGIMTDGTRSDLPPG